MARWAASAKWGEAPALDGQCATLLGLALSEGLGFSEFGKVSGKTCVPSIVVLAFRHCKSSRGTPRLRPTPGTLHCALHLAFLWRLGSAFVSLSSDTRDGGFRQDEASSCRLGRPVLTFVSVWLTNATATVFRLLSVLCGVM